MPLVSIVIPCYRQGHLLHDAISSALNQSYQNIEVIVVNDGSDDCTHDVADRFGLRIRYVLKANGGLSSARNSGIAIARGKYVMFLDSDDLLSREAVELLVLATAGRDDVIVASGFRRFTSDPSVGLLPDRMPVSTADPVRHMITWSLGPVHSFLCSAALARQVGGFNESLRSCEDWDFWIRLAFEGATVIPVEHVGAFYRDSPGSMSKDARTMLKSRAELLLLVHKRITVSSEMLRKYGGDLIITEQRVLHRLLAHKLHGELPKRLCTAIRDLEKAGIPLRRSIPKRFLRMICGNLSDRISISVQRLVSPSAIKEYRREFF